MRIVVRRPEIERYSDGMPHEGTNGDVFCQGMYYCLPEELKWKDMEDKYLDAQRVAARYRDFCEKHAFLAEAFPNLETNLGAGSVAAYLGSEVQLREDTIWYEPCIEDWDETPELTFLPENKWFLKHLELLRALREIVGDDVCVNMPDLMENLDILAALRGTQDLMMDTIDDPENIKERVAQINNVYFEYFDRFYDLIKDEQGGQSFSCFQIWGPGKTAKLCCDASAMISEKAFRDFALEPLKEQCEKLDYVLYHLDGVGAIQHVDALMEIDGIRALQWTPGDDGPDGTWPEWDAIYDKVIRAGKSLWIKVYSGGLADWIRNMDRIVKKYGSHSVFFFLPEMSWEQGTALIDYAEKHWCDIRGTFCEALEKG